MGVVTGFLGVWDGVLVIGLGMVFAAAAASYRMIKQGTVWFRLERAARLRWRRELKGGLRNIRGILKKKVFYGWGRICLRGTVCFY